MHLKRFGQVYDLWLISLPLFMVICLIQQCSGADPDGIPVGVWELSTDVKGAIDPDGPQEVLGKAKTTLALLSNGLFTSTMAVTLTSGESPPPTKSLGRWTQSDGSVNLKGFNIAWDIALQLDQTTTPWKLRSVEYGTAFDRTASTVPPAAQADPLAKKFPVLAKLAIHPELLPLGISLAGPEKVPPRLPDFQNRTITTTSEHFFPFGQLTASQLTTTSIEAAFHSLYQKEHWEYGISGWKFSSPTAARTGSEQLTAIITALFREANGERYWLKQFDDHVVLVWQDSGIHKDDRAWLQYVVEYLLSAK